MLDSTDTQHVLVRFLELAAVVHEGVAGVVWGVGVVLCTGSTVPGSNPGRDMGFFFYPKCPDRLHGPPILLFNGYRCKTAGV